MTKITRLQKEMSDIKDGTRSDCISVQQPLHSLIMVLGTHTHGISTSQYVTIT